MRFLSRPRDRTGETGDVMAHEPGNWCGELLHVVAQQSHTLYFTASPGLSLLGQGLQADLFRQSPLGPAGVAGTNRGVGPLEVEQVVLGFLLLFQRLCKSRQGERHLPRGRCSASFPMAPC